MFVEHREQHGPYIPFVELQLQLWSQWYTFQMKLWLMTIRMFLNIRPCEQIQHEDNILLFPRKRK